MNMARNFMRWLFGGPIAAEPDPVFKCDAPPPTVTESSVTVTEPVKPLKPLTDPKKYATLDTPKKTGTGNPAETWTFATPQSQEIGGGVIGVSSFPASTTLLSEKVRDAQMRTRELEVFRGINLFQELLGLHKFEIEPSDAAYDTDLLTDMREYACYVDWRTRRGDPPAGRLPLVDLVTVLPPDNEIYEIRAANPDAVVTELMRQSLTEPSPPIRSNLYERLLVATSASRDAAGVYIILFYNPN